MRRLKRRKKIRPPRQARLVPRGRGLRIIPIGQRRRWHVDTYARLLGARWLTLMALAALLYLSVNLLFAGAYLALGNGIENARPGMFADAFFFSVQTMATIGYGKLVPHGLMANMLVTLEAFLGFVYFALTTGLAFAKFSRPTARVLFSDVAVIGPYDGRQHLMLRLANERGNRIVDARLHAVMLRSETTREGLEMRRFVDLPLVRDRVPLLGITWTAMHAIDEHSPLKGITPEKLRAMEAEIIVSLTGLDETLAQTIHARHSYVESEIICNAAFKDILHRKGDALEVDFTRFHEVRKLA